MHAILYVFQSCNLMHAKGQGQGQGQRDSVRDRGTASGTKKQGQRDNVRKRGTGTGTEGQDQGNIWTEEGQRQGQRQGQEDRD